MEACSTGPPSPRPIGIVPTTPTHLAKAARTSARATESGGRAAEAASTPVPPVVSSAAEAATAAVAAATTTATEVSPRSSAEAPVPTPVAAWAAEPLRARPRTGVNR